jgi:glycosyltransferase involved in cell wall biosynthesis
VAVAVEKSETHLRCSGEHIPQSLHADIFRLMGRSRIAIGLGMSDGSPNTMLEAMIMGVFPIQSDTISRGEWIDNGRNGLLVPPKDPEVVAAIRRAITDSSLVKCADDINVRIADERLDRERIRREVVSLYAHAACCERVVPNARV